LELAEDFGLRARQVQVLEEVNLGGDGDEELLGNDELLTGGRLDNEFDSGVCALGLDGPGAQEEAVGGAEFGLGASVETADIGGDEEASRKGLDEVETEDAHEFDQGNGQLVTKTGVVVVEGRDSSLESVLLGDLAQRLRKNLRHWVGKVEAVVEPWPLRNQGSVLLHGIRNLGLRVHPCVDRLAGLVVVRGRPEDCRSFGQGKGTVESLEVLLDKVLVVHDGNSIVDRGACLRVGICHGVSSKPVFGLNHDAGDLLVLEGEGSIGSRRTATNDGDILVNDIFG